MDAKVKLILVEGIPGSGKTTAARFIQQRLNEQGIQTALFLEGDLDHPADYESTACLGAEEYRALRRDFPQSMDVLDAWERPDGEDYFFPYRKMETHLGASPTGGLDARLLDRLRQAEVYEQPPAVFERVINRRWQTLARQASQQETVYIFECCFLQNPLTMLLGRCGLPASHAADFVLTLGSAVEKLNPRLVYLHPSSTSETLRRVAGERPPEWLDFVIWYHTQQGYGRAHGLQGFDGLVSFYEMRQAVELDLLPRLPFSTLKIEGAGLQETRRLLEQYFF